MWTRFWFERLPWTLRRRLEMHVELKVAAGTLRVPLGGALAPTSPFWGH